MGRSGRMSRVLSALLALVFVFTAAMPMGAYAAPAKPAVPEATCAPDAGAYQVYPIPQDTTYDGGSFTLLPEVAVVAGEGVDSYTVSYLNEVLADYGVTASAADAVQEGKTNILLGVKGRPGAAADYAEQNVTLRRADLFAQNDAYLLTAKDNTILIQGKDADSVFHGVSTLKMMFSSFAGEKFLNTQIEDFASVAKRGYIEGFYGAWNFEERENLMRFARDYKMNSYVYAAKGDNYHTSMWDQLYPQDMLNEFANLVEVGRETKVEFAWSIHLGHFFSGLNDGNEADRYAKLLAKLDQLISVGVKQIDVLNDDFGGGSHAKVVEVLNRLNADLKARGCGPLTYCPQGYNIAWSGWNQGELEAMKDLDADINVYWTGHDVNSPITQESVDFLKEKSGHAADFWLNYPVNEHAKSGIYLGDITHYARDGVTGLAGFHSNPSRYAYANEVGLYQLAALVWNNNGYSDHADEVWESAFHYLQPEVAQEYFTIARNVANAPGSGRVPQGFPESEYLRERMDTVLEQAKSGLPLSRSAAALSLLKEFDNIDTSVTSFRANCANQDLVTELDPWLASLTDMARAGKAALESLMALDRGDNSTGWVKMSAAGKSFDTVYSHPLVGDGLNGPAKAGSKLLYPFVSSMLTLAKNTLGPILNPGDQTVDPVLFAKMGGRIVSDDPNTRKMYDGDPATNIYWQTVQQAGDYFGLDMGRVIHVRDIEILQGIEDGHHDIFHKARLEYSADGKKWTTLVDNTAGSADCTIKVEDLDIQARYIRYYLTETGYGNKPDYWTGVREFTVNRPVPEYDRIYTNVDSLKTTPLTLNGAEVSVKNLTGLTLEPGQYVGIKLAEPAAATSFVKEVSGDGLTLQYSYNGAQWTEAGVPEEPVGVGYLRLVNLTDASVRADVSKIGMSLRYLRPDATLTASNVGLAQGDWENLFDGDLGTGITTNGPQRSNTSITFDLGRTIEVYDVTAVMTDGAERLYNAKLQISTDNAKWQDVVTVANDNTRFPGPPHRFAEGNAQGAPARYLRILFTGDNGNALKLYELQLNRNVAAGTAADPVVSTISGNLNALRDNDISTLFQGTAKAGDSLTYRVLDNPNITQVSVLQGEGSAAKLYVNGKNGKVLLGTLDQSVSIFDTTDQAPVSSFVIEWDEPAEAAIYEFTASAGPDLSGDVGQYVEPNHETTGPVAFTNVAAQTTVTVSGTSDGDKENVKDGNPDTKWDSNFIKSNGQDIGDAWLQMDLGAGKVWEMNRFTISFFNKIYPTSWKLQVSDDGQKWTDVKSFTSEDNGPLNPVTDLTLDTPVTGRYVRFYFDTLNTAAAGNGVGVKEVEIYAREQQLSQRTNLALNKPVEVSGSETSSVDEHAINDGNPSTKWDSQHIKTGSNPDTGDAWFVIDLGAGVNQIDAMKISFFNKVYPTKYRVELSDNNEDWTVLKTVTKENNGTPHPVDEFTFEPTVSGRYVRFYFETVNTAAAGHGVAVNECEIYGRTMAEASVPNAMKPGEQVQFQTVAGFADVGAEDYFREAVEWAVEEGITSGVASGLFGSDAPCTRAQIVTFLWCAAGRPEPEAQNSPFVDVAESDYFYKAVLWAAEKGITSGISATEFGAELVCTRAQAMTFLYAGLDRPEAEAEPVFTDVEPGDYFYDAVVWAVDNEITAGTGATTFGPADSCTRAQIITFLFLAMAR